MKYSVVRLPAQSENDLEYDDRRVRLLRHPAYAVFGLRPAVGQHTRREHEAFRRYALGRRAIVEIGVAEGVSALALREGMDHGATLYLIDPFHLSRVPFLNFMKRAARHAVDTCHNGTVVWIEKFSQDAVASWKEPIDLLLIDGDHQEKSVLRDWQEWSRFIRAGGVAIFHDARVFAGGWCTPEYGPVKAVDRLFRSTPAGEWTIVEEIDSLVVVQQSESAAQNAETVLAGR